LSTVRFLLNLNEEISLPPFHASPAIGKIIDNKWKMILWILDLQDWAAPALLYRNENCMVTLLEIK